MTATRYWCAEDFKGRPPAPRMMTLALEQLGNLHSRFETGISWRGKDGLFP